MDFGVVGNSQGYLNRYLHYNWTRHWTIRGNGGNEDNGFCNGRNGYGNGSSISDINETLNLRYDNQIESITDKIKEGSEVMKKMARNLTSPDIAGISIIEKKNMVRDLAGQLSDFKSKFDSAKNKFDQMYNDTKRANIDQQHYLSVTQNRLTALNQEKNATKVELLELLRSKQDRNLDLYRAKAEFKRADRRLDQARRDSRNSASAETDWRIACAAAWYLIVPCIGFGVAVGDSETDSQQYAAWRDYAHRKLIDAKDLEEKMRLLRVSLERTEKLQEFQQQISTALRLKIQKQELILEEFSGLQQTIQGFKTEVDMVQATAHTVTDYRGIHLDSFVRHFKNLVEYIFDEDRFMWRQTRSRMEEKVQQIFSNLLSAETDLKIFKAAGRVK